MLRGYVSEYLSRRDSSIDVKGEPRQVEKTL